MIRAVIWKEIREQGLIGLTLVALGSGVLAGAAALAEPPIQTAPASDVIRHLGLGLLATLMLCVTAGMVCGGAVFAAEHEAGTIGFLDALPVSRWHLWRAKLFAGVGLAVAQVATLIAVAGALGLVPTLGWARAVGVFSLMAFVWGVFGSTVSRTTLGSIGAAIPGAILAMVAGILLIGVYLALFTHDAVTPSVRPNTGALFLVFMFVVPLTLSAWIFTKPDRLRTADDDGNETPLSGGVRGRRHSGVRALIWLALRQLRGLALVFSTFALLFGLTLLSRDAQPFMTWPALALAAGVLCGVTAFADEQTRGVAKFWGEQRLPLGRVWVVKVGLHFLMCLGVLLILAAPSVIRAQFLDRTSIREHTFLAIAFRAPLFDEIGRQGWKFLLVPAVYGFAAGHLCGLVFRKLVVACGVAGIIGGVGSVAWGPSLLSGGLSAWQLWAPPVAALVTARFIISGWAKERLIASDELGRLAVGCLASVLALAIGLGYRVLEVPDQPDGEADIEYVATLPPLDMNRGGTGFRTAAERHSRIVLAIAPEFDRAIPPPPGVSPNRRPRVEERLNEVMLRGWPAADTELANWLDRVFAPDPDPTAEAWYVTATQAAGHPGGVYEYPQLVGVVGPRDTALMSAQRMAVTLLARGLQSQAAGDPAAFVTAFRIVLTMAQTMRNGSIVAAYQSGRLVEESALYALDRWLDALPPQADEIRAALSPFPELGSVIAAGFDRPDLIRAAIAILEPLDPTTPFNPTPHFLAERYVIREAMKGPAQWLPHFLGIQAKSQEAQPPEVDLVTLAWAVPWEKERTRRLVGLGFEAGLPEDTGLISGRPGAGILIRPPRLPADVIAFEQNLRSHRRASLLKLALRAYRAEHGSYPDWERPDPLALLVQGKYLRRVPPDAYDESRPFGYRVAGPGGDMLRPRPRLGMRSPRAGDNAGTWFIPAGQAMVWCVGVASAGTTPPGEHPPAPTNPDNLIYLVPVGPNP
ncbi:MAG: hypothetical protein C0467_20935 [Planctomycetaceae bacterium]|nr:hypothetical protein [Planctomycetaceae bacterium]